MTGSGISALLAPTAGVLRAPYVPRLLTASLVGRLPTGMAALALLLTVRAHGGSYTLAGALTAIYAVSAAIGGPVFGRLIDRTRQPPVLAGTGVVSGVAFVVLALLDPVNQTTIAMIAAVVAGAATPQLEPCLRVLWSHVLRSDKAVHAAFSLDAATQELIFVAGPLVVLGVTTLMAPSAGLVSAGLLGLAGSLWFATALPARQWRGDRTERHWAGPLRSPGLVRLFIALAFVGATIGAFTVGITAYAEEAGARSAAGWLIAANAGGALTGGVLYTIIPAASRQDRRLRVLLSALAVGYAPMVMQPGLAGMAPLAVLSGFALPAVLACSFALVAELAPPETITEAHAWMITAFGVGNAAGSALAGALIDLSASRSALALSVLSVVVALLVAARPLLRRPS